MISANTALKFLLLFWLSTAGIDSHTTQRAPSSHSSHEEAAADDFNPFMELAAALGGQQGGGGAGALGGIVSLVGNLMQNQDGGKAGGGANNIGSIIAGVSSLFANGGGAGGGRGGGGFDPSIIGNVIEMFAGGSNNDNDNSNQRAKRGAAKENNNGPNWESLLDIAMTFMGNQNGGGQQRGGRSTEDNNIGGGLMSLLPMVMNVVNSFNSPEGDKIAEQHKDHAWILPPFLEKIHIMWDHFQQSELAQVLWMKSGLTKVFKGFTDRDGKMDYPKLFKSLENQNFRRRWIKAATDYAADWFNYVANPDVYMRYVVTAQMFTNGFLQSQGFPKNTQLDIQRPSETLSNLVDYTIRKYMNAKVSSITYIKPAVSYIRDLVTLGKARGLELKNMNTTDISEKLTDTLNLELIEPVLRVHRAYRFAAQVPHCDKYVLCEINSHDPNEKVGLATGFKAGITKFGSMAAAWFISGQTGTPFWSLFGIINEPHNCESRFPTDCTGFHDGEQHVTTEYVHNEL